MNPRNPQFVQRVINCLAVDVHRVITTYVLMDLSSFVILCVAVCVKVQKREELKFRGFF